MVLHHPNDLDLDLGLDLDLNLDLDFRLIDHWPYDIHLYDSTLSQWFYTTPMTLTLTLTFILTLTLSLILLDLYLVLNFAWLFSTLFNYMTLHHLNRSAPSQSFCTISIVLHHHNDLDLRHYDHWLWPWTPSPNTTILQYKTLHTTTTHHIAIISMSYWMSIGELSSE